MANPPAFPIHHFIARREVPPNGLERRFEASEAERVSLAAFLSIPGVEHFEASFKITPWRGDGMAVAGRVLADVVQTCVVTLDPVAGRVDEPVEAWFHADARYVGTIIRDSAGEEELAEVEALVNDGVDLGALAVEHVALGLDPYPRRPGVTFEGAGDPPEEKEGPFAALRSIAGRRRE